MTDKDRMKCLPILILFLSQAFAAAPQPPELVVKMFPLKYADSEQVRKLFSIYSFPMSTNRDFNVLTVTAPASFVAQVEAVVKQFDVAPVPPKNIELTVYLLTGADAPSLAPLPKELQEIEKQLIATSSYKAYHLADTQVIRTRPGQPADSTGVLPLSQVRFRAAWINTDEKGRIISFDGFRVQLKTLAVSTDIDLRENQLVVIGKANPDGLLIAVAKVSE
jgi:hypothetical protein